jgi:NitT/TauT family transport system substrate-binding protein
MVKSDSKITKVEELEGKKVGITSAGSGSDLLARWTIANKKVSFTRVPLGGGGLVPNLLSGNVDAVLLYSPLSFKMMEEKQGRFLIDFGKDVPPHLTGAWIATGKLIKEKPQLVQKTLNALYGGLHHLINNPEDGVKMVAEIDEIPEKIAALELDGNIKLLSKNGEIRHEWMELSLELAKTIGMTNLAPTDQTYVTTFKPVPTKK